MEYTIDLTRPEFLAAAATLCGKEETRYYLGGVCVTPIEGGGVYIVATDGYGAAIFHDEEGFSDGEYIIPMAAPLVKAAKYEKERRGSVTQQGKILTVANGILTVAHVNGALPTHMEAFNPIDGTYPDWRRTVPKDANNVLEGVFNADLLQRFIKTHRLAFGTTVNHCPMRFLGGDNGTALVLSDKPDWFGVVMPMSGGGVLKSIPFDVKGYYNPKPTQQQG